MLSQQTIGLLARFTSGHINMATFARGIEKRLALMRESTEMTEERKLLSRIELYLHEAAEGLRDSFSVYALAYSALEQARPRPPDIQAITTYFPGEPHPGHHMTSADKTEHRSLSLVR